MDLSFVRLEPVSRSVDRLPSGRTVPGRYLLEAIVESDFGRWDSDIVGDPVFISSVEQDPEGLRPSGRSAVARAALALRAQFDGDRAWHKVKARLLRIIEVSGYPGLIALDPGETRWTAQIPNDDRAS